MPGDDDLPSLMICLFLEHDNTSDSIRTLALEQLMLYEGREEGPDVGSCGFCFFAELAANLFDDLFFAGTMDQQLENGCAGRIEPEHLPSVKIEYDAAIGSHLGSQIARKPDHRKATSFARLWATSNVPCGNGRRQIGEDLFAIVLHNFETTSRNTSPGPVFPALLLDSFGFATPDEVKGTWL